MTRPSGIVASNSGITDPITKYDFAPVGVAIIEDPVTHQLSLPDPLWKSSNWLPFFIGTTTDMRFTAIIHGGIGLGSLGFGSELKLLFINNETGKMSPWRTISGGGPFFYDGENRIFSLPTVYTNPTLALMHTCSIDEINRIYTFQTIETATRRVLVNISGKSRGVPFWMGKAEGPYVAHGILVEKKGVDSWGGWVDICDGQATMVNPFTGQQATFNGILAQDREYHYFWDVVEPPLHTDLAVVWSAMSLHQLLATGTIDLAFLHSANPVPDLFDPGVPMEHQGRIDISNVGSFRFDDFTYSDDGEIPPKKHFLRGKYERGTVDLTAEIIVNYDWAPLHGVWWDPDFTLRYWGRQFVKWSGTITYDAETITINQFGFAEFTRIKSPPVVAHTCAIATAAYGSPLAKELDTLRFFRDQYLPSSLANLYYKSSPPIANAVSRHNSLRALTRLTLKPIIALLSKGKKTCVGY